jgi:hypothetical protein
MMIMVSGTCVYQQAARGDYSLIRELNDVMTQPYAELSKEIEDKYYRRKSPELFDLAGVSFLSCSSQSLSSQVIKRGGAFLAKI